MRSAGVDTVAECCVTAEILAWAGELFVFGPEHRDSLQRHFPERYPRLRRECLDSRDEYGCLDQARIPLLREKWTPHPPPWAVARAVSAWRKESGAVVIGS